MLTYCAYDTLTTRCDGCWLRVCEGSIQETRYKINGETDEMEVISDEIFAGKQVVQHTMCIKKHEPCIPHTFN